MSYEDLKQQQLDEIARVFGGTVDLKELSIGELEDRERRLCKRWDNMTATERENTVAPYILHQLDAVRLAISARRLAGLR